MSLRQPAIVRAAWRVARLPQRIRKSIRWGVASHASTRGFRRVVRGNGRTIAWAMLLILALAGVTVGALKLHVSAAQARASVGALAGRGNVVRSDTMRMRIVRGQTCLGRRDGRGYVCARGVK